MDVQKLISLLKQQATTGSLILDKTILSEAQVKQLQSETGLTSSQYVTIKNISAADIKESPTNTVTILKGNVDLLHQTGSPVKELTFTAGSSVEVLLTLAMNKSWTWTDTAPKLTLYPFSGIKPVTTFFIYSTRAQKSYLLWPSGTVREVALAAGLNFAAEVNISQLTAIGTILGDQTPAVNIKISGSWSRSGGYVYPLLNLAGSLQKEFNLLENLKLADLQLVIKIDKPVKLIQAPFTSIRATTNDLEFFLQLNPSMSRLVVHGGPLPSYNASLSNIAGSTLGTAVLPKDTKFEDFVPKTFDTVFKNIVFKGFNLVINLEGKQVSYVAFTISQRDNTEVTLGAFKLSGITLQPEWTNPLTSTVTTTVQLTAQSKVDIPVFTDPFDFHITLSYNKGWNVDTIEATYSSHILLTTIVDAIAKGHTIPEELKALTFSDFLVKSSDAGKSYTLSCSGNADFEVGTQSVNGDFCLLINKKAGVFKFKLTGGFTIGDSSIAMDITLAKGGDANLLFEGSAENISTALLAELFAEEGFDASTLPDILLAEAHIHYNTPDPGDVNINGTFTYDKDYTGSFQLSAKKTDSWEFLSYAALELKGPINIGSHLPLVGNAIPGEFVLKGASLIISSRSPEGLTIASKPDLEYTPGVSLGFLLSLMEEDQQVNLPVWRYKKENLLLRSSATTADEPAAPIYTLEIQKQLGPIYIDSLDLNYENQFLSCALHAAMSVGPLKMSLVGLSFGTSLTHFKPEFNLTGLGVAYTTPALTIDGAITRIPPSGDVKMQFDGALIVQAQKFGMAALASYAQMTDGSTSFFIFADVNILLGGPPFFMVTGLMGGFGFNRKLVMPQLKQIQSFPLLAIGGPQTGSSKDKASDTLKILEGNKAGTDGTKVKWIVPKTGDYWLAAGLKFSSFEIINGELLLIADFGQDLQFALLGLAWMGLPQGADDSETFVFIELQMGAVFKPKDGTFNVSASVTPNSFLLTKDCHLTGDFAFNLWFGDNPNAGQFVMTTGGYHPAFKAPAFYPKVARMGFNWQVSEDVSINGNSYFAITPSCGMAGSQMQVLYEHGGIKAWFTTDANFLITWHPLSFRAGLHIELGAAVHYDWAFIHINKSVTIDAWLDLWGPPLGGRVKVHIVIVDVTIQFGSSDALDKNTTPITWAGFKQLLPKPADICKISVSGGLTTELEKESKSGQLLFSGTEARESTSKVWVVRAADFQFTTQSVIPASKLTYGSTTNNSKNVTGKEIAIRPMNTEKITAVHNIRISKKTATATPIAVDDWTFTTERSNVAATLWGNPLKDKQGHFVQAPPVPTAETIDGQLSGFTIRAPYPALGSSFGILPIKKLMEGYILKDKPKSPLRPGETTTVKYQPRASNTTITSIGNIGGALATKRNALHDVLQTNGIYSGGNESMKGMAAQANNLFTANPLEQA